MTKSEMKVRFKAALNRAYKRGRAQGQQDILSRLSKQAYLDNAEAKRTLHTAMRSLMQQEIPKEVYDEHCAAIMDKFDAVICFVEKKGEQL